MSPLKTLAFCIKDRLGEIAELDGRVVVYQSATIESEFEKRMAKSKGKAVIIRLIIGTNQSRQKTTARFSGKYTVTLFTSPLLTHGDAKDADCLMEEIVEKLHGWWPESVPSNGTIWADVDNLTYPDDPQFDVTVLTLDCPKKSA